MMSEPLVKKTGVFFIFGVAIILASFLYVDTVQALFKLWTSEHNPTYSHGPLLLAVSIVILIRELIAHYPRIIFQPNYVAIILLVLFSGIWFLAALAYVQIVQMFALIMILSLIFISTLGWKQSLPYLFPCFILLGAIPVWDFLGPYLQWFTAVVSGWITMMTIHPSVRVGMDILIPAGTFKVDSGCSGLAYFIVSTLIALLYSYISQSTIKQALLHILFAMLIAVASNILRVYIIILSGELTNMTSYFVTVEHMSLGWVIFFLAISAYLWIVSGRHVIANRDNTVRSYRNGTSNEPLSMNRLLSFSIVLLLVISVGPVAQTYYLYEENQNRVDNYKIALPDNIGTWEKTKYVEKYRPVLNSGDQYEEATYSNSRENRLHIFVNHFISQRQGGEAVTSMNKLSGSGDDWSVLHEAEINPEINGIGSLKEVILLARNGEKKLLWSWYETNNTRTGNDLMAKFQNILGTIQGERDIRMITLVAEFNNEVDKARETFKEFVNTGLPNISIAKMTLEHSKG